MKPDRSLHGAVHTPRAARSGYADSVRFCLGCDARHTMPAARALYRNAQASTPFALSNPPDQSARILVCDTRAVKGL